MAERNLIGLADLCAVENGAVELLFQQQLAEVLADMADRPTVDTAREIVLTIRLYPEADSDGRELEEVRVEFEIKRKVPIARTRRVSMRPVADKGVPCGLRWNDLSPERVNQMTLDQETKDGDE